MAKNNEVDVLADSTLVFKAKTLNEAFDFNIPVFLFGGVGSAFGTLVVLGIDIFSNPNVNFTPDAYWWSLIPMANVLVTWPFAYACNIDDKLEKKGYDNKVTYWTALKSWYRIPSKNKKTLLGKKYVQVHGNTEKLHGDLSKSSVRLGQATHEVTDYMINDFKGIRLERHIEPMPLMLWDDALKTLDEGFGLKKV
jgi:hypothetical protein